jgi:hypothetical protein
MPTGNGQPRIYDTALPSDWTPGNSLYTPLLLDELRADAGLVGNQAERVDTAGSLLETDLQIKLWFPSALSAGEEAAADAVVLAHNGAQPAAAPDMQSDGSEVDGQIYVYDAASGTFKNVSVSGDISIDENGVATLDPAAITGGGSIDYVFWDAGDPYREVGNNNAYIEAYRFVWPGSTKRGTPTMLTILGWCNGSNKFSDLRIVDLSNGNAVIAEILNIPNNGGVPVIRSDMTLANISASEAIWQIQARKSLVDGDKLNLYSLHLCF